MQAPWPMAGMVSHPPSSWMHKGVRMWSLQTLHGALPTTFAKCNSAQCPGMSWYYPHLTAIPLLESVSCDIQYTPEIQHRYRKWCFFNRISFQIWLFGVSMLVFGGVLHVEWLNDAVRNCCPWLFVLFDCQGSAPWAVASWLCCPWSTGCSQVDMQLLDTLEI